MSTIAATTHDADIRCCGTQADWNNQPAKPFGDAMNGSSEKLPKKKLSIVRSDAPAARTTTRIAAFDRLLSQTATPIINVSDAKAVNQVRPISASQPLICSGSASSAALKCQR